jgi:hypothetical protein
VDTASQLDALINLAESLGIAIWRATSAVDPGRRGFDDLHPGGALVRLKGKEILFLDPTAPAADQLAVVAGALRGRRELQDRFLAPEVRQLIDGAADD